MTAAELVINIALKGSEKTVSGLSGIRKRLKEITSTSLEAKAGILAMMYGLQRLTQGSSDVATSLVNFGALTGGNLKLIQQWDYGLRQAGETSEEAAQQFTSLQKVMAQMEAGEGAPGGLFRISEALGLSGQGGIDMERIKRDLPYLMEKLRDYAKLTANSPGIGRANEDLMSVGFSGNSIAAARRGKLDQSVLDKAPTYSKGQLDRNAQIGAEWRNLGKTIEMSLGKLNSKYGLDMINNINDLVPKIMKLVESIAKLGESLKIFKLIGKVFEGWGMIFDELNAMTSGNKKNGGFWEWMNTPVKDLVKGTKAWDNLTTPIPRSQGAGSNTANVTQNNYMTVSDDKEVIDGVNKGWKGIPYIYNTSPARTQIK